MKDLKVTVSGVAAAAVLAFFCAGSFFVAVMLLLGRSGGDADAGLIALGERPDAPLLSSVDKTASPAVMSAPSVAPPTSEVALAPSGVVTHTVQAGENLYRISLAYGVSVADIMSANGLFDSRFITAGQELRIPVDRAVAPPVAPPSRTLEASGSEEASEPAAEGTASATATSMATPEPTATSTPVPLTIVNGLPLEEILVMPENVRQNALRIFRLGQELGRDPGAYSRLGDSTIENPHFMARFDDGPYNLGDYAYLQAVIDRFAGSHGRQGLGVRRGFHSWTVTDPAWADKSVCLPNESSVDCEIRVHNPSIMLIRLGSNDSGVPAGFEQNMRQVIDITVENGVIPVIGTKADRFEGSNINNEILRRLAAEYELPLWEYDLVASTIPGRGLDVDGVHLTTFYAHDYTSPAAFQRGHGLHNLTALMVLDAIWREVMLVE